MKDKNKSKIKELIPYIVILVVVVLLRSFIISPARVDGASMENTLFNGEIVLLNKISLKTEGINRFDIVVFKNEKDFLIKRVIGLPNELVEYKDNQLFINSEKINIPFEFEDTEDFKAQIDSEQYFLMGDNRDFSKDSRFFGPISVDKIKGKVKTVIFPFSKFGKVE